MSLFTWLRTRTPKKATSPASRSRTRLGVHQLEAREVPAAHFLSAVAVGADTAPNSISAFDNAVDAAGNSYVAGSFSGTIDFDPAVARADGSDVLTARGQSDPFVAKYAPDNALVWVRRMGSDYVYDPTGGAPFSSEWAGGIVVDGNGNAYVSGNTAAGADFGPFRPANAGMTDGFAAKLDAAGNFLWVNTWGQADKDYAGHITVDAAGNVYQVGSTTDTVNGTGWIANGAVIRKYSPAGVTLWDRRVERLGATADGVATDVAGNVYVSGSFYGTVDFNPDPKRTYSVVGGGKVSSGAGTNAYVLKLTGTGAFGWVAPFLSKTDETADAYINLTDLAVDSGGNVIAGGSYRGQVDVNPSSNVDRRLPYTYPATGPARANGVVVKLAPAGSLAWASSLEGGGVRSVAVDAAGAVYATGSFYGSFTAGPGSPTVTGTGPATAFVAKFTPAGSVAWSVTLGGTGSTNGYGIAVDAAGTVNVYGRYSGTVDLDPDPAGEFLLNNARTSAFLLKLRQS